MSNNLKIAIVQTSLAWEDVAKNIANFTNRINIFDERPDLVILPEMFTTGFSMNAKELAEPADGPTTQWMKEMASKHGFAICGSIIAAEDCKYFNRFLFVTPNGTIYHYDKRHLFTFANENKIYTKGKTRLVFEYLGWKIMPQICYDVRFPVWSRNQGDYDLLINVANFPAARRDIWETLLKARAIENQCFVAAANRVGTDGQRIYYTGDSNIYNYLGQSKASLIPGEDNMIMCTISKDELESFRRTFPVLLDADNFTLDMQ